MVFSGIANIAQWYPWRFAFPAAHFWMAWVTMGALLAHAGAKWAIARRALGRPQPSPGPGRSRPGTGHGRRAGPCRAEPPRPARGGGGGAGTLTLTTSARPSRPLRRLALLAPRDPDTGPQGHAVNRSAANAGVLEPATSPDYRLTVTGRVSRPLSFTADQLLALPHHEATLPIACVEGWSYSARWRGVRVRDLLTMAGAEPEATAHVVSLEARSPYTVSFLDHDQAHDRDTLLATHLDGQRLVPDHGFPLRLIGPGRPGVNQTKWVTRLVVE